MNFFEQQTRARAATRRMIVMFALAVCAIVAALDVVVVLIFGVGHGTSAYPSPVHAQAAAAATVWRLIFWTTLIVLATIAVSSLFRIASLADGGASVARALGASLVPPDTQQPAYRRLRNVVEEMAIAAGVAVPQIYVLEQEPGINAFAAGYAPTDAAVTVTRGALEKLSRDELQGVIAHEFSHVLNGDMRLNVRLMGLIFGITVLAIVGREVLYWAPRSRGRDNRGAAGVLALAIALIVFGSIGVFFARLIKASVSRQREYLADASAVQFTRQTAGLAGALKKAAGLRSGTRLQTAHNDEVAHMLFGDGFGYSSWFATHPPIEMRIRRLDPSFKSADLAALAGQWNAPDYAPDEDRAVPAVSFTAQPGQPIPAASVLRRIARPADEDFRAATSLHRALPPLWLDAAHDENGALHVLMALLLQPLPDLHNRQLALIATDWGMAARQGVEALWAQRAAVHPAQRLPLVALAMPALRRRPRAELGRFLRTLRTLIEADGQVSLFEYALARLLRDQVAELLAPAGSPAETLRLDAARDDVVALFAVVAACGSDDAALARHAFLNGIDSVFPRAAIAYKPPQDWQAVLDAALPRVDALQPAAKQLVVEGLIRLVNADGFVTIAEAELLRVICGALHCPLPVLLQTSVE